MSTSFTPQQLKDFAKYVRVQKSGQYNMFDPRARTATGLSRKQFLFVMDNYMGLQAAAIASQAGKQLEVAYPLGYRSKDKKP